VLGKPMVCAPKLSVAAEPVKIACARAAGSDKAKRPTTRSA